MTTSFGSSLWLQSAYKAVMLRSILKPTYPPENPVFACSIFRRKTVEAPLSSQESWCWEWKEGWLGIRFSISIFNYRLNNPVLTNFLCNMLIITDYLYGCTTYSFTILQNSRPQRFWIGLFALKALVSIRRQYITFQLSSQEAQIIVFWVSKIISILF